MNTIERMARKRHIKDEESGEMLNVLDRLYPDCKNCAKKLFIWWLGKDTQQGLRDIF